MQDLKKIVFSELQPPMNITLVTPDSGLPELSSFVAEKLNNGILSLDTETNVVQDFYFRKVRTVQVGDKNQQFVIDLLAFAGSEETLCETQGHFKLDLVYKPIFDILTPCICSNKTLKVGAYLSFEYQVMLWNFGQRIWHLYSTDLVERVIQAGRISLKKMQEFSMASIVARRFRVSLDKSKQESFDLKSPLTQKQIEYAAFDVRMPLSVRESQIREMAKDQLLTTAQIENDALGSFQDMHLYGMKIDGERWMKRIDATIERRHHELKILDEAFIPIVGRKTEQIDLEEMAAREQTWRTGFEVATPAEMAKAEEIRCTRDNAQKKVLREELNALEKARKAQKAEARKRYSELSKAYTQLQKDLPKCEGEAFINYGSNDQLLKALKKFTGMKTLESVGDDNLLKYNDRPMIQVLRKYRKGKKDTGTYGKQWTMQWVDKACTEQGWCHPWDGRIHAQFNQLEAETGRSSCQKPNMQNLTNDKEGEVHACFVCDPPDVEEPEGYVLVTTDMSGAELRIIAELSGEPAWIQAFAKKQDVHSVSTEILEPVKWAAGNTVDCAYLELDSENNPKRQKCKCPEHKKLRDDTKEINFQLCYGGGPAALADALDVSLDAAKGLMQKHKKAFPVVWKSLEDSGNRAQSTNEARDLYGRRRLLPAPTWESSKEYYKDEYADRLELEEESQKQNIFNFKVAYMREPNEEETRKLTHREPNDYEIKQAMRGLWGSIGRRGKNHCIQGSNASIIKRAMGCGFDKNGKPYLWHTLPQYKAKLLSMVHDELIIQCPKRFGEAVAHLVADAFKRAAAEVMSKVVMEAEWNLSDHWEK